MMSAMFLHTNLLSELKDRDVCGSSISWCAVAYWGKGALDCLELYQKKNPKIRILCDLTSGGCNPYEIKLLMKYCEVRNYARLHAKIYRTTTIAILGSANASHGGLGFKQSRETLSEAVYVVSDANELEAIDDWFLLKWSEAEIITKTMMEKALLNFCLRKRFDSDVLHTVLTRTNSHRILHIEDGLGKVERISNDLWKTGDWTFTGRGYKNVRIYRPDKNVSVNGGKIKAYRKIGFRRFHILFEARDSEIGILRPQGYQKTESGMLARMKKLKANPS